jgi:hypothetical protein
VSRGAQGVLSLWTLLRLAVFFGLFFGLLACLVTATYCSTTNACDSKIEFGYYVAQPFFFSVMMCFITLVGYLPYRALAKRGKLGLHRLSYTPID